MKSAVDLDLFISTVHCGDTGSLAALLSEHRYTPVINHLTEAGTGPLHQAATHGHCQVARMLIDAGADVNLVSKHGITSLYYAVIHRKLDTITLLVKSGASVHDDHQHGRTYLHHAAFRGYDDAVRCLTEAGCNVGAADFMGRTPLHEASFSGHYEVVRVLIEAGADLNVTNFFKQTPLFNALDRGHFHVARLLADAGACIDSEYEAEHANELRLWTAVLRGDLDELRRRIDAGDSVDQAPQGGKAKGWTALWLAVKLGREDAARMRLVFELIEAGANINATHSRGFTYLHKALEKGDHDVASLLIKLGADVDAVDGAGQTPLHMAIANGRVDFVQLLISAHTDVSIRDKEGESALDYLLTFSNSRGYYVTPSSISKTFTLLTAHGATVDGATAKISPLVPSDVIRAIVPENTPFWLAANNDAPMLAAELAGGLDPNMKTENGMTLLHWACAGDAPECVQLLLDAGADKEAGDPKPIFYCMHESSDCVKHLISAGIDVNKKTSFRRTLYDDSRLPLHYALVADSPSCVEMLVRAGSRVTGKDMRYDDYRQSHLQTVLNMHVIPVDALRALLAAAGERVLREKIDHMPPLHWAVAYSTVDGVRVLLEAGANFNPKYKHYSNVLQFAEFFLSNPPSASHVSHLTANFDYLKSISLSQQE